MVLNQPNQEFVYNGQKYYIGQRIYGTAESEYEGLFGSITEIRAEEVLSGGNSVWSCSSRFFEQDENKKAKK